MSHELVHDVTDDDHIVRIARVLILFRPDDVGTVTVPMLTRPKGGFRAGKPDLPGGRIDPGETALEAAVREAKEETFIRLDEDRLEEIYTGVHLDTDTHTFLQRTLFVVSGIAVPRQLRHSEEHTAIDAVPIQHVAEKLAHPVLSPVIAGYVDVHVAA